MLGKVWGSLCGPVCWREGDRCPELPWDSPRQSARRAREERHPRCTHSHLPSLLGHSRKASLLPGKHGSPHWNGRREEAKSRSSCWPERRTRAGFTLEPDLSKGLKERQDRRDKPEVSPLLWDYPGPLIKWQPGAGEVKPQMGLGAAQRKPQLLRGSREPKEGPLTGCLLLGGLRRVARDRVVPPLPGRGQAC